MAGDYDLIVVGASWGGLSAVGTVLESLPAEVDTAMAVVQHRSADAQRGGLEDLLRLRTKRTICEAEDKQEIRPRHVYIAPPDYHLLVERGTFALSTDERVQYARPSIDVLFESAADAYGARLIGIVLTGANEDGAAGLAKIKERGGVALVQDPRDAARAAMPAAAIEATPAADAILPLAEMGAFLYGLCCAAPIKSVVRP